MDNAERIARLCLCRTQSIGPITFYRLLNRFGSAVNALEALPQMASSRKKNIKIMSRNDAEKELQALHDFGGQMIVHGDEAYPKQLSQIEDAPPILNYLGDASLLNKNCVAIVGARNASANARRFTMTLARDLGQADQVIASGLARGIDTAAHEASLETGTVAVMAGGLDEIYPAENSDLYHAIAEQGCVLTEMPLGTKPTAHHFPRRNRIVSGLSKGTVVVEASLRSGSLITARLAGEQGREVFAVPGFPGDPRGAGPNMIQNGAKLVQCADDVLQELTFVGQKQINQQPSFEGINESFTPFESMDETDSQTIEYNIMSQLSHMPLDVDDLMRQCDVSVGQIQTVLLDMELAGDIQRHPGNRVSKAA
jgi:DNA processing protein